MGKERRGTEHAADQRAREGLDITDFEKRGCTDVLCLLLFILFWVVNFVIMMTSYFSGDINSLRFGTDYLGNRCGVGEYADRPKTWFPRMSADFAQVGALMESTPWAAPLYGLCVDECPTRVDPTTGVLHDPITDYGFAAPIDSPDARAEEWEVDMDTFSAMNRCLPTTLTNSTTTALCTVPGCDEAEEECVNLQVLELPSTSWVVRTRAQAAKCRREVILKQGSTVVQANAGPVWDTIIWWANLGNAVLRTFNERIGEIMLFGVGLSSLICAGWLLFLFFLGWLAVWLTLFTVGLLLLTVGLICLWKAGVGGEFFESTFNDLVNRTLSSQGVQEGDWAATWVERGLSVDEEHTDIFYWSGLGLVAGFVVYLIFICIASKQINKTIDLVEEATQVLHNSVGVVLVPLVTVGLQFLLFCFSLLSIVFIWTSDEETYQAAINGLQATYGLVRTSSESFSDAFEVETLVPVEFNATSLLDGWSPDDVIVWESGYVLVGFIWTYHFIYAISIATIGGCVVYYYFVDHDTAGHKDARFSDNQMAIPSIGMLYYVCRFNLGTMAFGSLVLAVVDVVRIFFEFLEAQTNKEDQSSMMAFILKCFRCFLWCFEKSIKGVSTYAYTYVIMQNDGFCGACIHSAGLIYNHFRQIAINAVVQSVLFVMQSVSIPMITTLIAYRRFQGHQDDETGSLSISDPRFLEMETWNVAIPTCMTFVVSFVMARCFAQVYEQIITSLTVCVLHDEHKYGGKYSTNACDGKIRNHYELDGPKFDPRKEKELM